MFAHNIAKLQQILIHFSPLLGSKKFCRQKMPFFFRQKVQISSTILPRIPNFASFSPSENEALSAVHNWYCC